MTRKDLENKSIFIIREAYSKYKNPALLWSMGKDSTILLYLCRKAFFGKIPFKVVHIDTGYKFKEIYDFRDKYANAWNLDIAVVKNTDAFRSGIVPDNGKFICCNARKTDALKQAVNQYGFDSLLVGIRRDEHGIRGKERYFSPRDNNLNWDLVKRNDRNGSDTDIISMQDAEFSGWNLFATDFGAKTNHVRVHPILHWSELDIWAYIKEEQIPVVELYFAKNGKRYRSIGCECCCTPVVSDADNIDKIINELRTSKENERDGRNQDKEDEYNMQKLRSIGYL
ncbi:MAG: sulfate adenylyltransferase subunit CysD [Nanoarchaeota archaeon]|nr:sulfate adenylyltransferase subunit CysD [Nanoarchaeota archaeon]